MKKWIHSVIAVLLASICLLPSAAFAADNTDTVPEGGYIAADPTEDDVIFTQEDLLILDAAEDYGATATGARTSGLITSATLKFAMNSNTMTISGLTKCVSGVKKCGFTKVVVMRRLNASYTWSPYKTCLPKKSLQKPALKRFNALLSHFSPTPKPQKQNTPGDPVCFLLSFRI